MIVLCTTSSRLPNWWLSKGSSRHAIKFMQLRRNVDSAKAEDSLAEEKKQWPVLLETKTRLTHVYQTSVLAT